jgi:hypothetical protein
MISTDIRYTGPSIDDREYPELFTVHHNGDYSGNVLINLEADRVEEVVSADSQMARHGKAIAEVTIPFEVLAKLVADAIRSAKVGALEDADYKKILGITG